MSLHLNLAQTSQFDETNAILTIDRTDNIITPNEQTFAVFDRFGGVTGDLHQAHKNTKADFRRGRVGERAARGWRWAGADRTVDWLEKRIGMIRIEDKYPRNTTYTMQ